MDHGSALRVCKPVECVDLAWSLWSLILHEFLKSSSFVIDHCRFGSEILPAASSSGGGGALVVLTLQGVSQCIIELIRSGCPAWLVARRLLPLSWPALPADAAADILQRGVRCVVEVIRLRVSSAILAR